MSKDALTYTLPKEGENVKVVVGPVAGEEGPTKEQEEPTHFKSAQTRLGFATKNGPWWSSIVAGHCRHQTPMEAERSANDSAFYAFFNVHDGVRIDGGVHRPFLS